MKTINKLTAIKQIKYAHEKQNFKTRLQDIIGNNHQRLALISMSILDELLEGNIEAVQELVSYNIAELDKSYKLYEEQLLDRYDDDHINK